MPEEAGPFRRLRLPGIRVLVTGMGLGAAISAVAIVGFGAFLGAKEVAGANRSVSSVRLARFLNVGIWPLAIAFGVFAAIKVLQVIT